MRKLNKSKYVSRKQKRLKQIPHQLLEMWFSNDEQVDLFIQDLISMEDQLYNEDAMSILQISSSDNRERRLREIKNKKCKNPDQIIERIYEISREKERLENTFIGNSKDLSLVAILNPETYTKKFIDLPEYRKELKRIAKREREELDLAVKNGYLTFDLSEMEKKIAKSVEEDSFIYKSQIY